MKMPCGQSVALVPCIEGGDTESQPDNEPGVYVQRSRQTTILTTVACPYCEAPMRELVAEGVGRVMKVTLPGQTSPAVVEDLPTHLRLVYCVDCKAGFTTPRPA